jgi:hypothetical protein
MPIESVDEKTGLVKCSRTSVFGLKGCTTPHWSDYFVENVFEGLSAPGEWYLDTPEGRLYYVPMPGESPDKTEVVAAGTYQFLRLMGDPAAGKFVTGLTFRGLTFRYSDWIQPEFDGKYFDPYLPEEKRRRQDATDCFYLHQMSYWKQGTKYANSPQSAVSVPGAIVMVGASDWGWDKTIRYSTEHNIWKLFSIVIFKIICCLLLLQTHLFGFPTPYWSFRLLFIHIRGL